MLHLSFKTSAKVFENKLKDKKPKLSFDLTSKPVAFEPFDFDCLEEPHYLDHLDELSYFDHSEKVILEKKMNETLHLKSKTSTKFLETESKDRKPKPSFDLTSDPVTLEPSCFDYLETPINIDYLEENSYFNCLQKCPTTSFESEPSSCDSEINLHLAYQPLEDEPDIDNHFGINF